MAGRKKQKPDARHRHQPVFSDDLCAARVDVGRLKRRGFPEVIYCPGKTLAQIEKIAACLLAHKQTVLLTRAGQAVFDCIRAMAPQAEYNRNGRLIVVAQGKPAKPLGRVLVISAGTGDIPVAEEAAATAEIMGSRVERLFDVGVAGVHRLLDHGQSLAAAHVLVVVAGMEGALASVVSGLTAKPVIGVPTSVGYGAHFSGLAPLLTMLNSCSPGVCTVNIDNGFGAGYLAHLINTQARGI
ncbi:MAG: nickel pincer cofactor biosynthesis protein LarB [Candidatus Omnitrophica bacterium]|nr:nickel pincer cofactor biosynthesis protein LarB [Candidatus Omnitrophota bacterium]